MAVKPVVYDDSTKKHRPLGSGEKMDGLSASSIISADSGNLITAGSDGLVYVTGSGIADPAADNLLEATSAGKLKVDIDRVVEWLDGHPSDAKDFAEAINVVSGDSGNLIHEGTDGGAYASSAQLAPALADGVTVVSNPAGKLSVGDVSGVAVAASGASAERALEDRFADFVNLKDFGAAGSGVADDTAAWTAWQTALQTGGMGYIPAGSYLVNGTVKSFPHGCIGNAADGFKDIEPPYTDRFEWCIPTGQGHLFENFRQLTIRNSTEGVSVAPTISIDAQIDVPADADPVTSDGTADGGLIGATHGIHIQHILTGGNANNRMYSTGLSTNAINDAVGDNDCGAIAARATKTANAGIGDTGALGGRLDNYSEQRGGVMGSEFVVYNHVQGMPCPADFSWTGTGRWASPVHVVCSADGGLDEDGTPKSAQASPITAGILMNGAGNSSFDGIEITRSTFVKTPGATFTINDPKADGYAPKTVTVQTLDGVNGSGVHAYGYLPGTVGLNFGSWLRDYGHPEYGIVMGFCHTAHFYTPGQFFGVRAKGIDSITPSTSRIICDTEVSLDDNGNVIYVGQDNEPLPQDQGGVPRYGSTGFSFAETDENGDRAVTGDLYYDTFSKALHFHNFGSNYGFVFFKNRYDNGNYETGNVDGDGKVDPRDPYSFFAPGYQYPPDDMGGDTQVLSKMYLGHPNRKFEGINLTTTPWGSSDERLKQQIQDVPQNVLDALGKVKFQQFKFNYAVEEKGADAARKHFGVIAQRIIEAFEEEGLDAFEWGFIGRDIAPEQPAVWDKHDELHPAVLDDDGSVLEEAWTEHVEKLVSPAVPASDTYSIRYEELLCFEAAYQRDRADKAEARIAKLEERMARLEALLENR